MKLSILNAIRIGESVGKTGGDEMNGIEEIWSSSILPETCRFWVRTCQQAWLGKLTSSESEAEACELYRPALTLALIVRPIWEVSGWD
jgi:hypothetical protein